MTFVEQRQMIEALRLRKGAMAVREREEFEMMEKRQKDDEQLDDLTLRRLEALHEKYVPKRSRASIDDAWAKLTRGSNGQGG